MRRRFALVMALLVIMSMLALPVSAKAPEGPSAPDAQALAGLADAPDPDDVISSGAGAAGLAASLQANRSRRFNLVRDTFIDGSRPGSFFGDASTMWAGFGDQMRPLVHAPLHELPANAVVDQAYLYLYVTEGRGFVDWPGSTMLVSVHAVTTEWMPVAANWVTPWINPGGDFGPALDTIQIGSGRIGTWWRFDITAAVAASVAGGQNLGFLLTSDYNVPAEALATPDGVASARFGLATKDHWDPSKVGYVRVYFHDSAN